MDRPPDLCSNCGEELEPWDGDPEERPACPECGSSNRTIRVSTTETVAVSGEVSLTRIREWLETNWLHLVAFAALTAAGFLLAGWLGLLFAAAAVPVGAGAFERVREIDRW